MYQILCTHKLLLSTKMSDYCKDNNTKKKKRIPDNVPNTVYTQIIEYENTSILRIVVLNT